MFFLRYLRDLRKPAEKGRGAVDIKPRISNVRAASKGVPIAPVRSATTVEIVSATRDDEEAFWTRSPLGLSLRRLESDQRLSHSIVFENQTGLGEFYNLRINASSADILVFVHDDVWIDDFFLTDRVAHGLDHFDVSAPASSTVGGAFDVNVPAVSTATLTAPTKPGMYAFHCNYHAQMHATLTVEGSV